MPAACVPTSRCGTHAPGWLSDGHPAVADGAAVDGLGTFASVTAETSTSTSCHQQSIVLCGTAETGSEVENKS